MKKNLSKTLLWSCVLAAGFTLSCGHAAHDHEHESEHLHGEAGHDHDHDKQTEAHAEDRHAHGDEIILEADKARAAGVVVEKIVPAPFAPALHVSGTLTTVPTETYTVAAASAGVVQLPQQTVAEGAAVASGRVLAWLTSRELLEGDPVARARAERDNAEAQLQRAEQLAAKQLVSLDELEQIRLRATNARIAYDGIAARTTPRGVQVVAPRKAFVKQWLVAQGDYVTTGQPLLTLTADNRMLLQAEVSTAQRLPEIAGAVFRVEGDTALYRVADLGGRLLSAGRTVRPGTFVRPVTFEFANTPQFVAGTFAEIWLQAVPQADALSVPLTALVEEQGTYSVYVRADAEGYFKRPVRIGASDGRRVQVLDGLHAGEDVVVRGTVQVKLAAMAGVIPEGHNHNH